MRVGRSARPWSVALLAITSLACASPEVAGRREAIAGGRALAECDWPNVGIIDSSCSATLIDPRWILTAAHCPVGARFTTGSLSAAITRCVRHPEFDSSGRVQDFMVCELDAPLDVATVPLLAPCEAAELRGPTELRVLPEGHPVVVIGLGQPVPGMKRAVDMEVSSFVFSSPLVDFRDPLDMGGSRPGDSGGPTFLALADGTWRQVGVHHEGGVGASVLDAFVTVAVPWIETTIASDVTPCHTADAWTPTAACADLPSDLEGTGGTLPTCNITRTTPTPTCTTPLDAGTLDAGAPPPPRDSGTSPTPDARSPSLDAAIARPDAATTLPPSSSGGCGCAITSRATSPAGALCLAALLLTRRRRPRRAGSP